MSQQEIGWRPGFPHPVGMSPVEAAAELSRIKSVRGQLTPANIVAESSDPTAKFYNWFEWDDSLAAVEHRKNQARQLVRCLVIHREENDHVVKAPRYVSVVTDSSTEYLESERAVANTNLRRQVIDKALKDLRSWQERYRGLVELGELHEAIENLLKMNEDPVAEVEPDPAIEFTEQEDEQEDT